MSSWSSNELLAERRLRSSELALETTRRRLVEANEEIGRLHDRVVELEQAVEAALAPGADYERMRAELERETAQRLAADQALRDERDRRAQLERALELSRAPWSPGAQRELIHAQEHARRLEGELEVVRRHAAEFEQAIRIAVDDVWRWLTEVSERLDRALRIQQARAVPAAPAAAGLEPGASGGPAAAGGEPVVPERLELARARLRDVPSPAATGGAARSEQPGTGGPGEAPPTGRRRGRLFRRGRSS